ncbi:hypothetical protein AKJ16_DCAP21379 [Drosera capensis]
MAEKSMSSGDRGQSPTRYELLSMVKNHSNLLGKTIVDEHDTTDVEMDQGFWHDMLNMYFISGRDSSPHQDDDLIFFVRKLVRLSLVFLDLGGYGFNDGVEGNAPYFVRRWAPKLDNIISEKFMEVDWRRSFYLNLIAHTSFTVTVAICSNQVLQKHRVGDDTPLTPIYKEVETFPAYPDICFAVDDFDSTFDAVVLTDTDHCYCVLLNAHAGAAFPSETLVSVYDPSASSSSPEAHDDSGKKKKTKVTIFSGFVSYHMVRDAYDVGRHRFGSLLSFSHSSGKTDRLYMKGPGGRGEVEVAVSGVEDQSYHISGPPSPVVSNKGFGIATIVRKAASVASVAAKQAYAAAAASRNSDDDMLPLKCCLMSISLPWEHIAFDLLFKVRKSSSKLVIGLVPVTKIGGENVQGEVR